MRSNQKKLFIIAALPLIVSIIACSVSVPMLQGKATPTMADTPELYTPAVQTKGPAPLTIWGCFYADGCPTANPVRDYFPKNATFSYGLQVPLTIYYGDEVLFSFEWCAKDRATLDANKENMEFVFTIDGVSYVEGLGQGSTSRTDPNNPSKGYPCFTAGAVLSGWKNGDPHQVGIGAKFLDAVNNGWTTSGAGDYVYLFMVNPNDTAPTRIPNTATVTFTPTRTRVPGGGGGNQPPADTPVPVYNTPVPTNTTVVVVPTNTNTPEPPPTEPPTEPPPCDPTGVIFFTFGSSSIAGDSGWLYIYDYDTGGFYNYTYAYLGETSTVAVCPGIPYYWDADNYDGSCYDPGGVAQAGDSLVLYCP